MIPPGGRAEHGAVGGGAHAQAEFDCEENRKSVQRREKKGLAADPTDEHAVAREPLVIGQNDAESPDRVGIRVASRPRHAPVAGAKRAAQIAALGNRPNHDHGGPWFFAGRTASP